MNDQGSHGNHAALWSDAIDWRKASCNFVNAFIAQHTQRMRPWQNTEGPIPGARIVEVNTQRNHVG